MTEPKKLGKKDVSPGGILMPARRFSGESPEAYENSVNRGNFMQLWSQMALCIIYE